MSENKFVSNNQTFNIKKSMYEVIEITKTDLKKRNIDLSFLSTNDLPQSTLGDNMKFKQIFLNLLLQSISGTNRGVVRVKVEKL